MLGDMRILLRWEGKAATSRQGTTLGFSRDFSRAISFSGKNISLIQKTLKTFKNSLENGVRGWKPEMETEEWQKVGGGNLKIRACSLNRNES